MNISKKNSEAESLADILKAKKKPKVKAPAYPWQDFALEIINDLGVPNFKRGSVFKVCKDYSKESILIALNDTKELCRSTDAWKYFFKIISERTKKFQKEQSDSQPQKDIHN